jgi:HK97 family phage prohead protease
MTEREIRTITTEVAGLELRSEDGRNLPNIYGYSAVFNVLSDNLGGFRERLAPTAFDRTLEERPDAIKAFHNHNQDIVIGSTRKGTLELSTDERGLSHRISPPDNEWGRPVVDAIERGDVEGMSFGFALGHPGAETWGEGEDGLSVRDVSEVKLFEISTVSGWPAYPQTSVGVRALADALGVEESTLDAAFRALVNPDGELTNEQHEMLMRAITKRTHTPYVPPTVAESRARMAVLRERLGIDAD